MAEKPTDTETQPEAEAKGKGKLLLVIVIAILFLGGAGAGGFFFLTSKDAAQSQLTEVEATPPDLAAADGGVPAGQTIFVDMPDLTVNLASRSGASRFLRLRVVLEVASQADADALARVQPRIIDDFQIYLRELRPEDLEGSAGSFRLRHDLLLRANQAAQPARVHNILFKEFLVQ